MLREFHGQRPVVSESAYVDPSAQVIGKVVIGEQASIWCNVTIRGDVNSIHIGAGTNIQDNSCLHVDRDKPLLEIGGGVVVGHCATVHGCIVENDCLIGMGSTLLSGARVGAGSIVAAGSLVLEGQEIPPRSLVMGAPAKVRRPTTDEEVERIRQNAQSYVELSRQYLKET
jgi:carbonic anhydrase/acetyltransferase-like protein (isoleucine patch superfamily)